MADPSVAVVIPTYRRAASLERCLRSLAAQTRRPDRVVVVVRGGDVETEVAVPRLQAGVTTFEQVVVAEPGVVAAIQAGTAHCSEDVVVHTDDDAAPHPDWIERLLAAYAPGVGGVGGRDRLEQPAQARTAEEPIVGRLTWYGRLHGNHHAGVGDARDVDVLKGVSMSMRRELWRLDDELRGAGAQVHWEVGVCLNARENGWRLVYDPAAEVDHFPAGRHDADDRVAPTLRARADAEWNYAYLLARHLPWRRLPVAAAYIITVGTRRSPGPVGLLLTLYRTRHAVASVQLCGILSIARFSGIVAGLRKRVVR